MTWRRASGGHLNAEDDNMFAPARIDYVASLAHFHTMAPSFSSYSHSSLLHTLFFVHFSSLSVSVSLFSSGCYISIMQPLPASEGERIRPTLPSVVACQPWLYMLSRLTEKAATLSPHIWNCVDRIIINEKQGPTVNSQQVNFVKLHLETNPTQSSDVWFKCPYTKCLICINSRHYVANMSWYYDGLQGNTDSLKLEECI